MTNIYTPQQQRVLLIISLIIIAGFILFGLSGYVSYFIVLIHVFERENKKLEIEAVQNEERLEEVAEKSERVNK